MDYSEKATKVIKSGGIGVIPTDTVYGIIGMALDKEVVERIYAVKKRSLDKPFIILISSPDDLKLFNVAADEKILNKYWPGKVSIVLPCNDTKFEYLHRGTNSLAFRLPADKELVEFIQKTGPLVAPSANIEGKETVKTIKEAEACFGDKVDLYIDKGRIEGNPSRIISVKEGKEEVIRGVK